jgi:N4-gp56 family major capsid protein
VNSEANDGALSSGDELTVGTIDKVVEIAKTASPMIRPIRVNGGEYYVLFIHPSQTTALRASGATSGSWADIEKARLQGGDDDIHLFKGGSFVGVWNGVLIYESTRLPQGIHSGAYVSNTRRAVFCGAQAAAMAVGQKYTGDQMFKWKEETFDYGRRLGVSVQCVWGLKKTVFNSVDYGSIVISSYAAAAA